MSYAIRAWRDSRGPGITIGTVFPVGYVNHVVEIELEEAEIGQFLADCAAGWQRARDAGGVFRETMPGPYKVWPDEVD